MGELTIVGRSSSHFTRIVRIFAIELGVEHAFRPVYDITSVEPDDYAGNPALKVPILVDDGGALYGTENICRELALRSKRAGVILRGDVRERIVANFEELTLHVMMAEVGVIMAKLMKQVAPSKVTTSIENSLDWLDANVDAALRALPGDRTLSFAEVAMFSLMRHLPFREVIDVAPWKKLAEACARFGEREGARATEFHFDKA